ncbi:DUF1073 domain-containing protein [Citrobacter koseri]|nr:DUF1073 domain-containing protein [Citrobacter koseri]EMD6813351.1 DUF1073 domain-containing protein [Citrobacter koseri]HEM8504863.1 DUF1073 domain-containing protein [Citrobacter koseri]HEM8571468.1 DUF1073 domain-containing protein [Citrobacter koseri]
MAKKTGRVATADSYDNFVARVGLQQPNQHAASTYRANYTSRNRLLVEWAYRSSWIIGAAVDAKPDDMTKKGARITSEIDPKRRGILEARFEELKLWERLNLVLKWSRLYGGAVGLILIEGQAPLTPLVLDKVGKGSFKGLAVLDRWMINPNLGRRIKTLGPELGKPETYDIVTTAQGIPPWTVNYSRLIRMDGITLPYQQALTENEWGMSVVERIFDRLTSYDSTSVGAAQLAYKAHLRTAKIKELRKIIAMGGKPYEALIKQMDMVRQFQTNEGMSLFDAEDTFETHSYSFAGLSDLLSEFKEDIAGAVGIPLVRLFRQSPKGFSTGDSDLANYYDDIGALQENTLRAPVRLLYDVLHRSEFGEPLPDDFTFEFNPLWQMSDVDRSTVASNTTTALATAVRELGMPPAAALTDLRETARVTGIGASITDEDIDHAKAQWSEDESETSPPPTFGNTVPQKPVGDSKPDRGNRSRLLRWFTGQR